jgi:glycosyltransferase involved in cell wall biosynthesis
VSPRIAVVLPTFDRAGVLQRAIESVLAQSEPDFELWVVDDGSRDGTRELIASFRDARLHYLRSEINRGVSWARNQGILHSSAEIVSFLDSDDCFLPDKLRFVLDFFGERPGVDALVDSFRVEKSARREKLCRNPVIENPARVRGLVFDRTLFKATPAISARRQALIEAGMFDESLRRREDMDLLLRLTRRHRCATSDRITWTKHTSPDRLSGRADTFLAATIDVCIRHPDYLSEHCAGLHRDLGWHFRRLLLLGRWGLFARDARRYRDYGRFELPLALLIARGGETNRWTASPAPPARLRAAGSARAPRPGPRRAAAAPMQ